MPFLKKFYFRPRTYKANATVSAVKMTSAGRAARVATGFPPGVKVAGTWSTCPAWTRTDVDQGGFSKFDRTLPAKTRLHVPGPARQIRYNQVF